MKKILILIFALISSISPIFAADYHYFYGNTCGHCHKVEAFFEKEQIDNLVEMKRYEVFANQQNRDLLKTYVQKLNLSMSQIWTPFLVINGSWEKISYLMGETDIINYFTKIKQGEKADLPTQINWNISTDTTDLEAQATKNPLKFLAIMIPLAAADSINPCAFAVMLLLLSSIFSKSKSKKKTITAGLLFSAAIFVSYLLIGMGFYQVLGYASITSAFKRIVGIIWILIGLANIKDYFWYGEGFLMEVPLSRRPTMMKLIQSATSPRGALVIGFLVSLFLLPCSSGPYLVILWLLKSENVSISGLGISYLIIYNLIFILPMIIITLLVGSGQSTVEKIAKLKNKNTKLMHLLIGAIMLLLWVYVIASLYRNI